jgi:hypothetical protein
MANRKLKNKGRYGDTEIRNVAGRKSHVNRKEAKAIDLYGMLGERLVQREGAGTRNPRTGMPEYHPFRDMHTHTDTGYTVGSKEYDNEGNWIGGQESSNIYSDQTGFGEGIDNDSTPSLDPADEFDKDAYMEAIQAGTEDAYLTGIGVTDDKLEYFKTNINEAYLDTPATGVEGEEGYVPGEKGFLTQEKELTEAGATLSETQAGKLYGPEGEAYTGAQAAFDIGERGVEEQFRSGEEAYRLGGLGITEGRRAAGAQYGLGMEQAGLGARRSLFDVKQQGDVATARSGLATSGTIAATTGRAQKGVFQDYTMQQKSLAEARGSAMTGLGIQEQGLESDWTGTQAQYGTEGIAMAGLTEDLRSTKASADISYAGAMGQADITRTGAQLDYATGVSDIGQTAEEEFWKNLTASG